MKTLPRSWALLLSAVAAWASGPAADFKLLDVNPGSERHNRTVSPRDYLLQVSAYYFGAAG